MRLALTLIFIALFNFNGLGFKEFIDSYQNSGLYEWFQKNRISTHDFEFDTIMVNGSDNLANLALAEDKLKVRLIEREFMKCMWDVEKVVYDTRIG